MEGQSESKKKNKLIYIIVIAAAAVVLVVALVNIIGIGGEDAKNISIYESMRSYVSEPDFVEVSGDVERTIDFESLQKINPDIVGWILIPDTKIDYPITLGRDNEYYISHSADNTENRAGAIFLDQASSSDFADQNTVIYGHNMNNGTMFAGLHGYEDAAFWQAHPYVYLFTPDGKKHEYRVFSAYPVNVAAETCPTYQLSFADDGAFLEYAQKMQQQSLVADATVFSPGDRIVTLSTCIKGEDNQRFVVQAVEQQG